MGPLLEACAAGWIGSPGGVCFEKRRSRSTEGNAMQWVRMGGQFSEMFLLESKSFLFYWMREAYPRSVCFVEIVAPFHSFICW